MLNKALSYFGYQKLKVTKQFKKGMPIGRQLRRYTYRVNLAMDKWRNALTAAEDPIRPNRELLYATYHAAMDDDQLVAQIRTAHMNIQMGDFELRVNGKHEEKITELFDKPWFLKYISYLVDTEFWGHSLIQPMPGKDGWIEDVHLIYREHVNPHTGHIILRPSDEKGISYKEGPLKGIVIPAGDSEDLGLLKQISKLIIRKEYNVIDWGRRNERFGIPFIVVKTADTDKAQLDEKERYLENLGASGWAIVGTDDDFEIKEAVGGAGGGHLTFKDAIAYFDKCVAFTVNGQTANAERVTHVGNAESQERQLNKYTLARMRRIQYHLNYILLPWLARYHNYPTINASFHYLDLEVNEEEEKIQVDNTVTEKKKEQDTLK